MQKRTGNPSLTSTIELFLFNLNGFSMYEIMCLCGVQIANVNKNKSFATKLAECFQNMHAKLSIYLHEFWMIKSKSYWVKSTIHSPTTHSNQFSLSLYDYNYYYWRYRHSLFAACENITYTFFTDTIRGNGISTNIHDIGIANRLLRSEINGTLEHERKLSMARSKIWDFFLNA